MLFEHETPRNCIDCHRADDVHKATLGTDCAACHSSDGWLEQVRFDHDLTNFPLIGLHVLATCEECHTDSAFGETSTQCQSCHQDDDVHKARPGPECETCHNPNGWEFWIFNHNGQTKFNLAGAHDGLKCDTCHTESRATNLEISQSCASCHRNDDIHRGAFGNRCGLCHGTKNFKGARLR